MSYGKALLTAAAEKAGSRYALSKLTDIPQSHMSDVILGRRDVPASWVLKLSRVAGVDPTEAMEHWDLDQAEKKRLRRLSSRSEAGGVVATLLFFVVSVVMLAWPLHAGAASGQALHSAVDRLHIVLRAVLLFIRKGLGCLLAQPRVFAGM